MGVRSDLADAIAAAVNPTFPGVQIYAHPEDVTQVPCLVLVPDEPWAEIAAFGKLGTLRWSFNVAMVASRADVEGAIELFEQLRVLILNGIATLGGKFKVLGKPDTLELAGIQVMSATMEIELMTERQT